MQILVAIPVYDGKVPVETTRALLDEKAAAHLLGDDLIVEFLPGCSHPGIGRNQLAQTFMDSNYDRLVFLDSDVTWNVGELIRLARSPVEFVGGCYRHKAQDETYPIQWLPDPEQKGLLSYRPDGDVSECGLISVASLPGGFLALSRSVFEKIRAAKPDRTYPFMDKTYYAYFEMPYMTGGLWGEDGYFCNSWRTIGGEIWLDPMIELTHWSFAPVPHKGTIGKWLGGMNSKDEKQNIRTESGIAVREAEQEQNA